MTTEDVKFSYERIADPALASPWAYQFEQLDHVEVVDERNGIIHLKNPVPADLRGQPALLWRPHHLEGRRPKRQAASSPPRCRRPAALMLFTSWEQKQKVTLTANPDWPGPKPDFGKVEIYVVADDQAAQLAYEANAFDYTKVAIAATEAVPTTQPAPQHETDRGAVDALPVAEHQHARARACRTRASARRCSTASTSARS